MRNPEAVKVFVYIEQQKRLKEQEEARHEAEVYQKQLRQEAGDLEISSRCGVNEIPCPGMLYLKQMGDMQTWIGEFLKPCPEIARARGGSPDGGGWYTSNWKERCVTCDDKGVVEYWEE